MDKAYSVIKTSQLNYKNIITYPEIKIQKREIVFLSGKSGSGKTTLLRLMNKTISPTSGEIYYNGQNIEQINALNLRKKVSLVSQKAYLFPGTIEENIRSYYEFREEPVISFNKIKEFMDICCVDFGIDKESNYLSGGEKQRIFLAIMLSFEPDVLLLDEPTSALDRVTAHEVIGQIQHYCKEKEITIVAVSHDRSLVEGFADREIQLEKGMAEGEQK